MDAYSIQNVDMPSPPRTPNVIQSKVVKAKPRAPSPPSSSTLVFWILCVAVVVLAAWVATGPRESKEPVKETSPNLYSAASVGDYKTIKQLLKRGTTASVCDKHQNMPIYLAAMNGNTKAISLLLNDKRAGWAAENKETPLHLAAMYGNAAAVKLLLKKGSKASARDEQLRTPLHLAAMNGNVKTISILLKEKNIGWFVENSTTPIHLVARYGNAAAVTLISRKSDHNWKKENAVDLEAIDKLRSVVGAVAERRFPGFFKIKTFTAMELAAIFGHANAALAFPYSSDEDFWDAISCACMIGDAQMVETLWHQSGYRKGWFSDASGVYKQRRFFPAPPLHLAVMAGSRDTVAFLLEKHVDVNDSSKKSLVSSFSDAYPAYSSPVHYAAAVGSIPILKSLLRNGAYAWMEDSAGRTPLSYAVEHEQETMVDFLIEMHDIRDGAYRQPESKSKGLKWYLGSGHPCGTKVGDDGDQGCAFSATDHIVAALKASGTNFVKVSPTPSRRTSSVGPLLSAK
jgi:ankyrin repeat protein